ATGKMQDIVGARRGGKPVFSIDKRAIGSEVREEVFISLSVEIGHRFAVTLYNLKLIAINPDTAFEIAPARVNPFGRYVEKIGMAGLKLLLAYVVDVVIWQLVAGKYEGHTIAEIINVLFCD